MDITTELNFTKKTKKFGLNYERPKNLLEDFEQSEEYIGYIVMFVFVSSVNFICTRFWVNGLLGPLTSCVNSG